MAFDTAAFLQSTFDQALDTSRIPVPPGDYTAQVNIDEKAISVDTGVIRKGDRTGQNWFSLVVNMTIADPSGSLKAATGRDPVVIRHNVFLDMTPDEKIDFGTGKNIGVGKLFAAAGWPTDAKGKLNPGFSWGWLRGKTLKIKVENEPNPKDPTSMFERITAVTKA